MARRTAYIALVLLALLGCGRDPVFPPPGPPKPGALYVYDITADTGETAVITLPTNFKRENSKVPTQRALIVALQEDQLSAEQTTQADWAANTANSQVRWTSPVAVGDVELDGGRQSDGAWSGLTSGATARQGHTAVEYNGKMYIFGGVVLPGAPNNTLWEYDIAGNSWTQKTSGATGRYDHSAVVYNGKMYIFGGHNGTVRLKDIWECDLTTFVWTQKTTYSGSERAYHSAVVYSGKMYAFGGYINTGYNAEVWEYDIAGDSWTQKTSGASSRGYHSAVVYEGKMYVFGGFNGGSHLNDVWQYDIAGDSWTQKTSGATQRIEHSAGVYNGKIYIFGGRVNLSYYNDVWEYDIAGDGWTQRTSGATQRANHSAIIYIDKMYVFGGDNNGSTNNSLWEDWLGYYATGFIQTETMDIGQVPTNDGEFIFIDSKPVGTGLLYEAWYNSIDDFVDSWLQKTSGATSRNSHSAVAYNGKMYVFGGYDGTLYLNDIWEYDIEGDSWLQKTSGATGRFGHSAIVYNGKIYVFGGIAPSYLNDVWEYDIAGDSWLQKTSGATGRYGHIAVLFNGKMFIFGGLSAAGRLNDVWEYDIAGDTWLQKTSGATARQQFAGVQYNGKMYIFGGYDGTTPYVNDVWEYDIAGDSWLQKTSGATKRVVHSAVLKDDKMIVFGGLSTAGRLNDVWEYYITSDRWRERTSGATVRSSHSAVENNGKMYVFGGYHFNTVDIRYNQVWEYDVDPSLYLGIVVDGEAITERYRYWQVRANFSSDADLKSTPILQSVAVDFTGYVKYSTHNIFSYPPLLKGVGALRTTISMFDPSTINQITLRFSFSPILSAYLTTKYPKNKLVRIYRGFANAGFAEADFIDYGRGQIDDWEINEKDEILVKMKDFKKEWSQPVPETWESVSDNVVWTSQHPVDVKVDILRNKLTLRESKFELSTFNYVRDVKLSGWKVSRTITGDTDDGKELLEELRKLCTCYFIPQINGKIRLSYYDPDAAAVRALTDNDFITLRMKGNSESLKNLLVAYHAWDGDGDSLSDFLDILIAPRTTSQANWGEVARHIVKDKWTGATETSQLQAMSTVLLDRFENIPPLLEGITDARHLDLEVADLVTITTKRAPSANGIGYINKKFEIVNKQDDYMKNRIRFEFLAV